MNSDEKSTRLSVLVVDDEVNIRKRLSYCLEVEGHDVTPVSNPADAAESARSDIFGLRFIFQI